MRFSRIDCTRLLDCNRKEVAEAYGLSTFGESSSLDTKHSNPWQYQQKRIDYETGLIYFGQRYYDPDLGRWLTQDPVGFADSLNLYQYVWNNPLRYYDPDGRFAFAIPILIWGAELLIPTISTVVVPIVYGAISGAIAYGGYKGVQALNNSVYTVPLGQPYVDSFSGRYVLNNEVVQEQHKKEKKNNDQQIIEAKEQIEEWLGDDVKVITNPVGDKIIVSEDGKRKIRFDFERPFPHKNPHAHIEELINGAWIGHGGQIYPQDVPNK